MLIPSGFSNFFSKIISEGRFRSYPQTERVKDVLIAEQLMGSLCEVDLMQKTSTAEISVWFANAPRKHADPVETRGS